MKKILSILLTLSMIFLVACSNEEPLLVGDSSMDKTNTHVEFFGKKDDVKKMVKTTTVNVTDSTEEEIDKVLNDVEKISEELKDLPIEYDIKREGKKVIENVTLNFTDKEKNKALQQYNLMYYEGDLDKKLEIEPFYQQLKVSGYNLKKNY